MRLELTQRVSCLIFLANNWVIIEDRPHIWGAALLEPSLLRAAEQNYGTESPWSWSLKFHYNVSVWQYYINQLYQLSVHVPDVSFHGETIQCVEDEQDPRSMQVIVRNQDDLHFPSIWTTVSTTVMDHCDMWSLRPMWSHPSIWLYNVISHM